MTAHELLISGLPPGLCSKCRFFVLFPCSLVQLRTVPSTDALFSATAREQADLADFLCKLPMAEIIYCINYLTASHKVPCR